MGYRPVNSEHWWKQVWENSLWCTNFPPRSENLYLYLYLYVLIIYWLCSFLPTMSEYVNSYPSLNQLPKEEILIIADSRGRRLDVFLSSILKVNFGVITCSGAGLIDSIIRAKNHMMNTHWSQIYYLAGICSLTNKDKVTKKVSSRYYDPLVAARCYNHTLVAAYDRITSYPASGNTKIIFAPITGMSLATYNREGSSSIQGTISAQDYLNRSIVHINREIVKFNVARQVITPWLSRTVHRRHRRTNTNSYHRLSPDGCHLSDEIYSYWAHALKKAVLINANFRSWSTPAVSFPVSVFDDRVFSGYCHSTYLI